MYIAILAGGVGSRLWPRSRQSHPKQFSDITGSGRTMIQETVDRLGDLARPDEIYVVTGERYADLTAEQLPQIPRENIIVEPSGRNTAPAIGLTCAYLHHRDQEAVVAVLSADQIVMDASQLQASLRRAETAAQQGHLVTVGIEPLYPHTGYGYIKRADALDAASADNGQSDSLPAYTVAQFLEKPDRPTAEGFLAEGGYYWNGGMFVCKVAGMFAELQRQLPAAYAMLQTIEDSLGTDQADHVLHDLWEKMPSISIDYAVVEGAERVAVVPLRAGWNDVGSWDALDAVRALDENQNCVANGELLAVDSQRNIVYSDKLVTLIGLEDIVVVDTGDALLVGKKDQMQKVKNVVETLKSQKRTELL